MNTGHFDDYRESTHEIGVVSQAQQYLVHVDGLPHAHLGEVVLFATGQRGEVYSMEEHSVEVLLFEGMSPRRGTEVVRTETFLSVPVDISLLGRLIDPLGRPLDGGTELDGASRSQFFGATPRSLMSRTRITRPLLTGVAVVDLLLPLGKGQRELLVGERKTGKTSFLQSAILSQVQNGSIVVYAGIGKSQSEVAKMNAFFQSLDVLRRNVVFVASYSSGNASLVYYTPYAAMTIAEFFSDLGYDVLVVLDDLTAHAHFYRELSLLGRRFPGRDSYPGDVFFVHSRLLERAGAFTHAQKGEVAITCLPLVEIVEGDLTNYISTNVMGMTDGHLYFDINIFNEGRRPPINVALSVTRVGKQTQTALMQDIQRRVTAFLNEYEKLSALSHFGAELSDDVRFILERGRLFYTFFDQHFTNLVPINLQILFVGLIWQNAFAGYTLVELDQTRTRALLLYFRSDEFAHLVNDTVVVASFDELITKVSAIKERVLKLCQASNDSEAN